MSQNNLERLKRRFDVMQKEAFRLEADLAKFIADLTEFRALFDRVTKEIKKEKSK